MSAQPALYSPPRRSRDTHRRVPSFTPLDDLDWLYEAACHGMDSRLFFLPDYDDGTHDQDERTLPGRLVCQTCPVREPCLEYALANRERHGIWGGLTTQERRRLAQRRRYAIRRKGRDT